MDQGNNNNAAMPSVATVVCGTCGRKLQVRIPSKPGGYKFACPHCQSKVSFRVNPASAERKVLKSSALDSRVISHDLPQQLRQGKAASSPARGGLPSHANIPVLGAVIVPAGKRHYQIMEKAEVNRQYRFVCPGCSKYVVIRPSAAGKLMRVRCAKCGTVVLYQSQGEVPPPAAVVRKTPPPVPAQGPPAPRQEEDAPHTVMLTPGGLGSCGSATPVPPARPHVVPPPVPAPVVPPAATSAVPPPIPCQNVGASSTVPPVPPVLAPAKPQGMLSWKVGKKLHRRTETYRLMCGRNTIGRYDPDLPSNAMIQGDGEMSRQSVEINVVPRPDLQDYIYELRVLRSTNNVLVNGQVVNQEKVVLLSHGDTLCLGKTTITFVKVPH